MPLLVFLLNILVAQERLFTLPGPNLNVSQPAPNSKNWSGLTIYLYLLMESHPMQMHVSIQQQRLLGQCLCKAHPSLVLFPTLPRCLCLLELSSSFPPLIAPHEIFLLELLLWICLLKHSLEEGGVYLIWFLVWNSMLPVFQCLRSIVSYLLISFLVFTVGGHVLNHLLYPGLR